MFISNMCVRHAYTYFIFNRCIRLYGHVDFYIDSYLMCVYGMRIHIFIFNMCIQHMFYTHINIAVYTCWYVHMFIFNMCIQHAHVVICVYNMYTYMFIFNMCIQHMLQHVLTLLYTHVDIYICSYLICVYNMYVL